MVTGPRAIQNTWPLVFIFNMTRDMNPLKNRLLYSAFSNLLETRTAVCVPITDGAEGEIDLLGIFRKYIVLRPKVSSCKRFFCHFGMGYAPFSLWQLMLWLKLWLSEECPLLASCEI